MHSARIAGNERIAAGRLARCRSIVAANQTGGCGDLGASVWPSRRLAQGGITEPVVFVALHGDAVHSSRNRAISGRALRSLICEDLA